MIIEKQYIQELQDWLRQEQSIGNTWVAYTQEPYPGRSIHFFKHEAEVKNFCIAATKSIDESVYKPIYFIRKTEDLNLAVLKELDHKRKHGDLSGLHVIGLPRDYDVEAIAVKGIYLPDLKRVIDDSIWHEYKNMGLDWGNRHESMWWELNGSDTVDRIDRDVLTLLDDQRTKNIVEQLIGKDYIRYFDRSLLFTDEQRAKIESQLVDYPFAELNDAKRKQEIIELLGRGDASSMTLEKRFYPEPEIGQYLIFEHLYPEGMVYERGHSVRKLDGFHDFSMALDYLQVNALKHLETPNKRISDLLVIGQYRGKELLFDYEGLPESHTGLHIATGWKNGNGIPELIFQHIPHEPILLKESFDVFLDGAGTLRFNDGVNDRKIDVSFWKSGDENVKGNVVTREEQLRLPFTNDLVEKYFEAINSTLKYNTMNENNVSYLKGQVKVMGHGEAHNVNIEENIRNGKKQFESEAEIEFYGGNRKLKTILHFNQKNPNELHFWNGYTAILKNPQGIETSQYFYINTLQRENPETNKIERRTVGFTPKESCNLLDKDHKGNCRAVFKEYYKKDGTPYLGWKKLDLNNLDERGNHKIVSFKDFDLEKVLDRYNIAEEKEEVLQSLKKGNLHAVTIVEGEEKTRQYFAADPANLDILVYDRSHKLIYQNNQEVKAVKFITEKNAPQGEEQSISSAHLSTAANGQQNGVAAAEQSAVDKEKEPLLSNGTTNQSQDGKGKDQSNVNNKDVDNDKPLIGKGKGKNQVVDNDEPLITKGKGKKGAKNTKVEEPGKNGPPRGKGSDDKLLEKNGTSTKKGVGVK